MKKRWTAPLALAFAIVLVSAAASAPRGAPVTVTDPTGDNQTAPDVTSLTVRQEGGRVVYEFAITGRPDKLEEGEFLVFFIDADNNLATGVNGAGGDYLIEFEQKGNGLLRVDRYDSTKKEFVFDVGFNSSFGTLWGSTNAPTNIWRFYFTPSMFDIKTTFNFWGRSESAGEGDSYTFDRVPDTGTSTFVLTDTVAPVAKALPGAARAGSLAKLSYQVNDASGQTREVVTVRKGAKTLATVKTMLHATVAGKKYSAGWKVPAGTTGALRFCVQAFDAAGNKSAQSCAPLTVG